MVCGAGSIAKVAQSVEHSEHMDVTFDNGKAYSVPSDYIELFYYDEVQ